MLSYNFSIDSPAGYDGILDFAGYYKDYRIFFSDDDRSRLVLVDKRVQHIQKTNRQSQLPI